ncbi:MAG: SDR family NAD(P)-dependent oxidoreductase [Magnetococcales bacterium]|nr:SDR family NAD(P)-dependent oxidoreductase [Magnetococcales bacterium]
MGESGKGAGRAVLITGCSTGIGRTVAQGLRDRGYRVLATARKRSDVASLIGEGFEAARLDLSDEASIQEGVAWALEACDGALYGLFNNGAYGQPGALEDLPVAALRAQFESNVFGTYEVTRLVLPAMRERGAGRIIQNSSVLGFIAMKYRGAYVASKYALEGLSDALRLELDGSGIQVVLIEPGPIRSMFRKNALAAFQRHVDAESSRYHKEGYAKQLARRMEEGQETAFTLPPEAVLKRVIWGLEKRRPKVRYPVCAPTYVFAWFKRVLPQRWLDFMLKRF